MSWLYNTVAAKISAVLFFISSILLWLYRRQKGINEELETENRNHKQVIKVFSKTNKAREEVAEEKIIAEEKAVIEETQRAELLEEIVNEKDDRIAVTKLRRLYSHRDKN